MATATIPEVIQPGLLFVPNDAALSIASSWCPNTDDALSINGATANFRAYQPAISGIHYPSAVGNPFSLCYWIDQNTGFVVQSASSTGYKNRTLAGVMDIAPGIPAGTSFSGSSLNTGWRWSLHNWSTNGTNTTRNCNFWIAVGASSNSYTAMTNPIPTAGTPQMYALLNSSTTRLWYGNGANLYTGLDAAGTPGTPGALTAPFFALGPYATTTDWTFPAAGITKLAKFSIWNRLLTTTELSDLYTSMTLGPPSP